MTQAVPINGQIGGFYNFLAFVAALAMLPLAWRFGWRALHVASTCAGGIGLLVLPQTHRMLGSSFPWRASASPGSA